jgi:hypothetical protein
LRSQDFSSAWAVSTCTLTAASGVAPDGTNTAGKLAMNNGSTPASSRAAYQTISGITGFNTVSIFAKSVEFNRLRISVLSAANTTLPGPDFTLSGNGTVGALSNATSASITPVGNGWYRCVATFDFLTGATAARAYYASIQATGDGTSGILIWGAQLETGVFPTSYIPTAGAAATRTADLASVTGTNFSSWYNQTEGTIYLEAQCLAAIAAQTYLAIDNGTSNNLITVRTSPSSATFERAQIVDGGVTQVTLEAGGYTATSINNFGFAYKVNDFARSINGSSVLTDTSGTVPTVNQLFIGSERGQYFVNGHICRIVYYPTRLSNEKLRALTS